MSTVVKKLNDKDYTANCIICQQELPVQVWPLRTNGKMTGSVFCCTNPECIGHLPFIELVDRMVVPTEPE